MLKIQKALLFVAIMLLSTSCIEIVENIKVNKDKSGTISYSIEAMDDGSLFSSLTSMFNVPIADQMRVEANKLIQGLVKQPGISNVEYNIDGRSGNFYLQFDFDDYRSFSNALYSISGNKKTFFAPHYFKIGASRIKKINFAPWLKKYLEQEEIELSSPLIADIITYKAIIQVPDDIRRVNPKEAIIQASKRETLQRFRLSDILENKVDTGIKVRY